MANKYNAEGYNRTFFDVIWFTHNSTPLSAVLKKFAYDIDFHCEMCYTQSEI